MTFRDVRIGGVLMDTHNRGVDVLDGRHYVSPREAVTIPTPGAHGRLAAIGAFGAMPLVLQIWVDGTAPDGSVDNWSHNLDVTLSETLALVHTPTGVVQVSVTDGMGNQRVANCRVSGGSPVREDTRTGLPLARLTVTLEILDGMWLEPDLFEIISSDGALPRTINLGPNHPGGGAPIRDLSLEVTGPITNPTIRAGDTWVRYGGVITSGETLLIDTGPMTAHMNGVSVLPRISYAATARGAFLGVYPPYQIQLEGSSAGTPTLTVRGRRAFL